MKESWRDDFPTRPNRVRHTKQVTVRIDEILLKAANQLGTETNRKLTEVVEDALWDHVRHDRTPHEELQLRFLVRHAPHDLKSLLLNAMALYYWKGEMTPFQNEIRKIWLNIFAKDVPTIPGYEESLRALRSITHDQPAAH